jgi:lipopolysaccharide transport system ATP-binding protein
MSDPVIRVENLGKRYTITHEQRERYTALRDVLTHGAKRLNVPYQWLTPVLAEAD